MSAAADAFVAALRAEGFTEFVTVERPPLDALPAHTHPFEAKALILDGEISIRTAADGSERLYRAGDVFQLAAHASHEERYGPRGVRYLVGRRPAD